MSRIMLVYAVLGMLAPGCRPSTVTPHTKSASDYVSAVSLRGIGGEALSDRIIAEQGEDFVIRLEIEPSNELPAVLERRPVLKPQHWEFGLLIGERGDDQSPAYVATFSVYAKQVIGGVPGNHVIGVGSSEGGVSLTLERVSRPAKQVEGHVYRYARLPLNIPPDEYRTRIVAYPTADPLPSPGLQVGARTFGPPIIIGEFQLKIGHSPESAADRLE